MAIISFFEPSLPLSYLFQYYFMIHAYIIALVLLGSYLIAYVITLQLLHYCTRLLQNFFTLSIFFCCCRPLHFITGIFCLSRVLLVGPLLYFISFICHAPLSCRVSYHEHLLSYAVLFVRYLDLHKLMSLLHSFIAAWESHGADFVDEFQ